MKIMVIYTRDGEGIINDCDLEYMIRTRKIVAFERQGEWVTVNKGPIRENPSKRFLWDRRKTVQKHIGFSPKRKRKSA